MVDRLRVGIAGYGVVGKRRRHYIDIHPAMRTVVVCDRTFKGVDRTSDGLPCCTDYHALLQHDIDVLFVCMTNDIAPDVTVAGLNNGLHVFCEKPPGRTVEDVERVITAERNATGCKLKYGFNHRYHESVQEALQIVRSGSLGRVINLRGVYGKSKFVSFGQHSDWRTQRAIAGGGILLDQGIHLVDLMRLFAGDFTQVHSFVSNDFWKHDVEDNAYAIMRTDNGIVAMLHSSATQWRHRFQLDITLAKGALTLAGILSGSKSYGEETLTIACASDDDQGDPRETMKRYENDPSWGDEIQDFAEAILKNRTIERGSSTEALATMKLVQSIYRADCAWSKKWNLVS